MAQNNTATDAQIETEIPAVAKVERFRTDDHEPVARIWFENGGAVSFEEHEGLVHEEYILPDDPHSIYESYPLQDAETTSIYEHVVTFLDDLNDYSSVEDMEDDYPAAALETLGLDLVGR